MQTENIELKKKTTKTGQTIAKWCRIPGFSRFFLNTWDGVSHKMFGEASGFKNIFYPKGRDASEWTSFSARITNI